MAAIDQLTIQGSNVVNDLHDRRITTTAITTCTHILASQAAGLTSIAPITAANLASVLGEAETNISTGDQYRALRISKTPGAIFKVHVVAPDSNSMACLYLFMLTGSVKVLNMYDNAHSFGSEFGVFVKEDSDYVYIYHTWANVGVHCKLEKLSSRCYGATITEQVDIESLTLTDIAQNYVSTGIPSFYKDYSTLAELKAALDAL